MKTAPAILPKNLKILKELGENIKLARLRRRISSEQMAERTGTSRKRFTTLSKEVRPFPLAASCKSYLL